MSVIVAGSVNMDIVAFAARHPRPGETVEGRDLKFIPGGKGSNQAVAAARLGARTRLVARVGKDGSGETLERFLREQGVDLSFLRRSEEAPTGVALIVVAESAENEIVIVAGANGLLSPEDIDSVDVASGDVLVSQFEIPLATVQRFLERGKRAGGMTILNPAPMKPCPRELREAADTIVVNETELESLLKMEEHGGLSTAGMAPKEVAAAADRARLRGDQVIVVTLGSSGAVAATSAGNIVVPGRRVKAVDTTGAGDCFVGALAASLASGEALAAAMGFANRAASVCVQRVGAGISMPGLEEIGPA